MTLPRYIVGERMYFDQINLIKYICLENILQNYTSHSHSIAFLGNT